MFTLEESALLRRMLRAAGWAIVVVGLMAAAFLVFHRA